MHGIDFYFYFLSKNISLHSKKFLLLFLGTHVISFVITVEECHVPYIMAIAEKHEGWSQAG